MENCLKGEDRVSDLERAVRPSQPFAEALGERRVPGLGRNRGQAHPRALLKHLWRAQAAPGETMLKMDLTGDAWFGLRRSSLFSEKTPGCVKELLEDQTGVGPTGWTAFG